MSDEGFQKQVRAVIEKIKRGEELTHEEVEISRKLYYGWLYTGYPKAKDGYGQ